MKPPIYRFAALAASVFSIGAIPALLLAQPTAESVSLQPPADDVVLDLAVHDRRNKPILNLRPDEISITDNGAPAKLTGLHLVNGKKNDEPLITLLFDRPGLPPKKKKAEEALFGGSASAARETSRRLRDAGSRFLKSVPANGFQFAVFDIWGRLQIEQEYTADRKQTMTSVSAAVEPQTYGTIVAENAVERRVVQVAKTGQDASGTAAGTRERTLARTMYAAMQTSSHISKDQHLSLSLACLLALVESQQSLPGRKAVVYFPPDSETNIDPNGGSSKDSRGKDAVRSIIGAANRAGVNIYVVVPDEPVDDDALTTLLSIGGMSATNSSSPVDITGAANPLMGSDNGLYAMETTASAAQKKANTNSADDDLTQLARQTGGDVFNSGVGMSKGVKGLIRGLTTYYEASFVPASDVEDGSFHATAFKTTRRGLRMRAQTGYLALPPSAGITETPQPFELPLMALLKQASPPSDLDYRAAVLNMGHEEESNVSLLALEVPVSALEVHEDTSTHLESAHVSVLATINDSTGTEIERFSEDIARRWEMGKGSRTAPDFISFERSFAAPPGKYVLDTAIIDRNSGKAAARRENFEVSPSRAMPELSEMMVVRGIEPTDADSPEPDLLWRGNDRVEPNLYGQLPSGVHDLSVFFLARPDPKSQEPATVKLEVLHDGVPLKGQPLTPTLKASEGPIPVLVSFSINSAEDGEYEARAILTQAGKSAGTTGRFALMEDAGQIASAGPGATPLRIDPPELAPAPHSADRPGPGEIDQIVADVRRNAIEYGNSLPDLICQQTTNRFIDARSDGDWKPRDSIVEVLTYVNHQESRTVVGGEQNHAKEDPEHVLELGMISTGEFGVALSNLFKPESKAEFTWKEIGTLRGDAVDVFGYRVEQVNSSFSLTVPTNSVKVGYHGEIYVDRSTHGVKSITMFADDVPKKFPIRRAAVRVDYDYVAINDHDYLLPVSAQVVAGQGGNSLERNDLEFSNFRKFGSNARIVGSGTNQEQP
jgi:VWFA-related protein